MSNRLNVLNMYVYTELSLPLLPIACPGIGIDKETPLAFYSTYACICVTQWYACMHARTHTYICTQT